MCEECGGGDCHQQQSIRRWELPAMTVSSLICLSGAIWGGISTPGLADFKANRPWHTSRSLWPLLSPDGSKRQLIIDL